MPPPTGDYEAAPSRKISELSPQISKEATPSQSQISQMDFEEGDPLGATNTSWAKNEGSRLDFAAFASQNAFQDR